jgi:signal peptidase I
MSLAEDGANAPATATSTAEGSGVRSFLWEILQTVLLTLFIFMAVRAVVQNFKVEGSSMEPTLHSGQYLLINKVGYLRLDGTPIAGLVPRNGVDNNGGYLFGGPQRGDIIVFRSPVQPDKDFIKRVIAVPGDTVEIRNGQVLINGEVIQEPYILDRPTYLQPRQVVPPNHYYVLGDNRKNSSDSHVWGLVPAENVIGRAWVSYWPPNQWGVVPDAAFAR